MKLPSVQQVIQDSTRTLIRFPLVLINAVLGTIVALVLIDYEGPSGPTILFNILFATILGIPLLIGIALAAEKKRWKKPVSLSAQAFGVFLLVVYAISVPSDLTEAPNIHTLRLLILAIALHFFVAVAPFIGNNQLNGFWHYNKTLFLRIFTGLLYTGVLYAGLSIALAALDHLFGMDIPGKRYGELWILINGLFTTWFFLAGIPENLDSLETLTDYPKGIKIFAQYILLPLVLVYLVILYAYIGKILITWDWPQGWVSKLILGFSVTGILSLLLLYPVRDRVENVWIQTASRWFYVVMIPLVPMLILALWRRIWEYGVTEDRYIAVALGIWLGVTVVYFIISKSKNIKFIPGSLCVLSLFISFGPWGAFDVSERSQIGRLEGLLTRNSILVDGTIRKAPGTVLFEDTKQISSILSYLHDIHGYDRIQPWFRESLRRDSVGTRLWYKSPDLVAKMMGIEYVSIWQSPATNMLVLNANYEGVINVDGYGRMLRAQHIGADMMKKDFPDEKIAYRVSTGLDTITFVVTRDGKEMDSLQIDLRQLVDKLLKDYGNTNAGNIPPEKMSVSSANQSMKVKIYLRHVEIRRQDNYVKPISYDIEILYSTDVRN